MRCISFQNVCSLCFVDAILVFCIAVLFIVCVHLTHLLFIFSTHPLPP